ncbi:MAG: hypothetical protein BGO05_23145 [Rhizobiales bacterium 63-7]|nr:hypothetical protein [Hyphomicrobiales bacterium]OJU70512.1 MAG: hypothetical protein BGO05_23145 [Rhizobiales bacterium 63-7]
MVSHPAEAASAFPAGVWSVRRKVIDHVAGQRIAFEGTATITRDTFAERDEALVDARKLSTVRRYRLRRGQAATEVFFPDGRPFMTFTEFSSQRIEHHCGNDLYTGRFVFVRPEFWAEFWRVRGDGNATPALPVSKGCRTAYRY